VAAGVLAQVRDQVLGCNQKTVVRTTDVDGAFVIVEGVGAAVRVKVGNATAMARDGVSWAEACACAAAVDYDEVAAVGARELAMTAAVARGVVAVVVEGVAEAVT